MARLTLNQISPQKNYKILNILPNTSLIQTLHQLGFIPGSIISLVSKLPFKGSLAFKVRGSKFALRCEDASCIQVEPA